MRREIVIAGILLLAAFGCGESHTQGPGPESDSTESDSTEATRPQVEGKTPSPGTVQARVAVETCKTESSTLTCTMTVRKVLAYGMSTSPLAVGQSLTATFSTTSRERGTSALTPGRSPIVVLREQGPSPTASPGPEWRIIEIRQ